MSKCRRQTPVTWMSQYEIIGASISAPSRGGIMKRYLKKAALIGLTVAVGGIFYGCAQEEQGEEISFARLWVLKSTVQRV